MSDTETAMRGDIDCGQECQHGGCPGTHELIVEYFADSDLYRLRFQGVSVTMTRAMYYALYDAMGDIC